MQSASVLYNEIHEALKRIEQSADRAAEKIVINRKDYLAMLIDTMAAPFVKENITKVIRRVEVEVSEDSPAFVVEECWVMKPLVTEVTVESVVATEVESEQLDLFSVR